ncbi:molecular chaperone [Pseudescherichia sp.]|uniref:fimbrial biogenesis chaperone n=1 Tax=Pseudescherichia sp. TaxID=2055881 RepID=UPI002897C588|nr:molecular chaperone [Pseudescherichia sp.]
MIKYKHLLALLAISSLSIFSQPAAIASITLGGTRFVYHASDDSVSVNVNNRDNNPYLVQSWVSDYYRSDSDRKKSNKSNIPFIITPPLFKISSGDTATINIIKTAQDNLPKDRESIFYLNVKAIPGVVKNSKSSLLISVNSSMKLFYRPAAIEGEIADSAWEKLTFQQSGHSVTVSNPTPYFVTLHSFTANGKKSKLPENAMLDPFGALTIPVAEKIRSIAWTALIEQGQITSEKSMTL